METLQYKNIKFQVWVLGGQACIRPYWRCYYPNTDAVIYVVDSADVDRLDIAKQELHAMLEVNLGWILIGFFVVFVSLTFKMCVWVVVVCVCRRRS